MYKYAQTPLFATIFSSDKSKIAKLIAKHSKTAKKWTTVDVDLAASEAGLPRADAVRKLQEWNDSAAIELQPSGVVNRFRILKQFPHADSEKDVIITAIYDDILEREKSDMMRIQEVIDLVTATSCLSRKLAGHFGDADSVPKGGCGHCSFCVTKSSVSFIQSNAQQPRKGRINETRAKAILKATDARDDARYLARIAFGISSPRVTSEKLGKHAVFGSMSDCDFEVSLPCLA